MTSNPELVDDVKDAFEKSVVNNWLESVEDTSLKNCVKAKFKAQTCNASPWTELRKKGIVPTAVQTCGRGKVQAYFTRVKCLEKREEITQVEKICDCCGQQTQETETKKVTGIKTNSHRY